MTVSDPDVEQALLRARAQVLAQARQSDRAGIAAPLQVLAFRLAQECYAVEIEAVREVCPLKALTPLPGVPAFVMGIVNVRGRVVSVLDLKRFFNLPEAGLTDLNKIVLLGDAQMEFGLLANAVVGVRALDGEMFAHASLPLHDARLPYLKGVGEDHLIVLDARRLLDDPRMIVDDDIE